MRNVLVLIVMLSIALPQGLARAQEPGQDPSEKVETKLPIGPILLGSLGVTTLVVGAGLGWQVYEENKDFNDKADDGTYPLATDKLADGIETHSIVADVFMFGGLAIVIGSVLWWLIDDDYDLESDSVEKGELSDARWRPEIGLGQANLTIEF